MELPVPRYFLSENAKVLKEREKLLGSILAQMEAQDDTKVREHGTEHSIMVGQIGLVCWVILLGTLIAELTKGVKNGGEHAAIWLYRVKMAYMAFKCLKLQTKLWLECVFPLENWQAHKTRCPKYALHSLQKLCF